MMTESNQKAASNCHQNYMIIPNQNSPRPVCSCLVVEVTLEEVITMRVRERHRDRDRERQGETERGDWQTRLLYALYSYWN